MTFGSNTVPHKPGKDAMATEQRPMFIPLDAIPEDELAYLPKLCDEPRDHLLRVACEFLEYLGLRKATIVGLDEHLHALQSVRLHRPEAEALAIAAYEHASARGLTDIQRGSITSCSSGAILQP
jgi:hypothetical protein